MEPLSLPESLSCDVAADRAVAIGYAPAIAVAEGSAWRVRLGAASTTLRLPRAAPAGRPRVGATMLQRALAADGAALEEVCVALPAQRAVLWEWRGERPFELEATLGAGARWAWTEGEGSSAPEEERTVRAAGAPDSPVRLLAAAPDVDAAELLGRAEALARSALAAARRAEADRLRLEGSGAPGPDFERAVRRLSALPTDAAALLEAGAVSVDQVSALPAAVAAAAARARLVLGDSRAAEALLEYWFARPVVGLPAPGAAVALWGEYVGWTGRIDAYRAWREALRATLGGDGIPPEAMERAAAAAESAGDMDTATRARGRAGAGASDSGEDGHAHARPVTDWPAAAPSGAAVADVERAALRVIEVVTQRIGAMPDAPRGRLALRPRLSRGGGGMEVKNLKIGDAVVRLGVESGDARCAFELEQTAGAAPIRVALEPDLPDGRLTAARVDGSTAWLEPRREGRRLVVPVQVVLDAPRRVELDVAYV